MKINFFSPFDEGLLDIKPLFFVGQFFVYNWEFSRANISSPAQFSISISKRLKP
jgi:hypothetical protein